jgi:hypothetical protein
MCPLVILLYLYAFFESTKKKKWIRYPIPTTRQYDQTYCYLSLMLVQIVQLLIPVNIVYLILQIALLSLKNGEAYATYFRPIYLVSMIVLQISRVLTTNILFVQAFEWFVIKHLIETQKNRKIEEILFDFNNENMN